MDFVERFKTTVKKNDQSLHNIFGFIIGDLEKQKDVIMSNKYSDLCTIKKNDMELKDH